MLKHWGWLSVIVGLCLIVGVPHGIAADFPAKDITLVCPWSAGGGTDTLSRALVKNAKQYFGVNVNVVNKTGGMGAVGMGDVANAKSDGYTVCMLTTQLSTYRLMGLANLSYRDFDLLMLLNRSVGAIAVKADAQWKTIRAKSPSAIPEPVGHGTWPWRPWPRRTMSSLPMCLSMARPHRERRCLAGMSMSYRRGSMSCFSCIKADRFVSWRLPPTSGIRPCPMSRLTPRPAFPPIPSVTGGVWEPLKV